MRPTVKLGEICDIISGQSPESKYYNNIGEGLPFFQGKTEFSDKYIGNPKIWTTHITKESLKNDILMSVRAPVGPVNINGFDRICIGRGLCAIRPGKDIKLEYLFNYLIGIQDKISGNRGSVFDSINRKDIEGIEIPLPPLDEQIKIIEYLNGVNNEINNLIVQHQLQIKNLYELKNSILNKTFKGKN